MSPFIHWTVVEELVTKAKLSTSFSSHCYSLGMGANCPEANCPRGQLVLGGNCPGANYPRPAANWRPWHLKLKLALLQKGGLHVRSCLPVWDISAPGLSYNNIMSYNARDWRTFCQLGGKSAGTLSCNSAQDVEQAISVRLEKQRTDDEHGFCLFAKCPLRSKWKLHINNAQTMNMGFACL